MMRASIWGCSLLLLLFSVSLDLVQAQQRSFDCGSKAPHSEKASIDLLTKVQERYRAVKSYSAEFLQSSFLSALEVSEASSGSLKFAKPGRMRWEYRTPDKQLFITDADTLWLYQEEDKQVLIDKFSTAFISDLPVSFLVGLGDLKRDFTPLKVCENADGIVLELLPKGKDKEQGLERLKLLVSPSSYLPTGASIVDLSGNTTSFLFTAIKTDLALNDETFKARFPSGVDIIDRREK